MRAKASTYGSISTVLVIVGLALFIGSDDSAVLIVLGALVAMVGVAGFAKGVILHSRAAKTAHRI